MPFSPQVTIQLSIIIPVFNVELYILDCLSSIINQINFQTEIIVVDDGSTDQSIPIAQQFLATQPATIQNLFTIIHQENQGVSAARNHGLKHAQGRYVTFLDSDDILLSNYIEHIYSALISNADIIQFNFNYLSEDLSHRSPSRIYIPQQFQGHQPNSATLLQHIFNENIWFSGLRVYKVGLFDNINFPSITHFEDAAIIPTLIQKAQSFYIIQHSLYGYRVRQNSATHSKDILSIQNSLHSLEFILQHYLKLAFNQPLMTIPLMHFFRIYMEQSVKFRDKKTAKKNWQRFASDIRALNINPQSIRNEHSHLLVYFLQMGLSGFYLSKVLSKIVRAINKRKRNALKQYI